MHYRVSVHLFSGDGRIGKVILYRLGLGERVRLEQYRSGTDWLRFTRGQILQAIKVALSIGSDGGKSFSNATKAAC